MVLARYGKEVDVQKAGENKRVFDNHCGRILYYQVFLEGQQEEAFFDELGLDQPWTGSPCRGVRIDQIEDKGLLQLVAKLLNDIGQIVPEVDLALASGPQHLLGEDTCIPKELELGLCGLLVSRDTRLK